MEFILTFKDYLLSKGKGASQATVKNYLADVKQFIAWFERTSHAPFAPQDVTLQHVHMFQEEKEKTLSESSLDRHVSSLRKFFTFLKLDGQISHSPFEQATKDQGPATDPWHLHDFKNFLYVYNASSLTIKNYIIDVKQFLTWAEEVLQTQEAWHIADKDVLAKITSSLVEEYKQRLLTQHIFSASSINRKLSSLRKYISWASEQGLLSQTANNQYPIANIQSKGTENARGGARSGSPTAGVPLWVDVGLSSDRTPDKNGSRIKSGMTGGYSNIPPIRLIQKLAVLSTFAFDLLIVAPIAHTFQIVAHETWKLRGKPLFTDLKKMTHVIPAKAGIQDSGSSIWSRITNKKFGTNFKFVNISKEFYAPLSISTRDFSLLRKLLYHIRYTRPNWYRRYHRLALAHYFNWMVLIIFSTALGFGLYNTFIARPGKTLATAPTTTTPIRVLSFQGRLTDANDNPITTASNIRFIIYNTQSSSSSARLWEEVDKVTPDQNGIFSLLLGSSGASDGSAASLCNAGNPPTSPATGACGIPSSLFANNNALWLGVTVEATAELAPREQLATVAFASNAETLQGLPPIGASTHTNVVLALNSSGNLDIGASTTFQSTSGQFAVSGNTLALNTNTGTNGDITLYPDGQGYIDVNRPIRTTTNNSNISSLPNGVEIDDMTGILATSSGQSALTIVQNGAGPIISASSGASPKFTLQNDGTIISGKYQTAQGVLFINDTAGTVNETAQGGAHTFLRGNGASAPTFNAVDLSTADVANALTVDKGGLGANLSGSAAVGDLLYADSTTTFHRLAIGTSTQCLIGGTTPSWSSCSGASNNYWQVNGPIVSPADLNNDLAVGGNSTSSAKFQVFAESVGPVVAGTASTSGNLTFAQAHGTNPAINILNGNSLNFNVSPNGDSGTGYVTALSLSNNASAISLSTSSNNPLSLLAGTGTITIGTNSTGGNVQFFNGNNTITNAGLLTIASNFAINGTTETFGAAGTIQTTSNNNLSLLAGTGNVILGTNTTGGNVQFFNSSNTVDKNGNLTLAGTITLPNSITLTGLSNFLQLNHGIEFGGGTSFFVDGSGNATLNSLSLPIGGGLGGYLNLANNVLAPTNIQNDLVIGGIATLSARFHAYGTVNQGTTPGASISAKTSFATLVIDNTGVGDLFTASTSGNSQFTIQNSGTIKDANYINDQGILYANTSGIINESASPGSTGLCLTSGSSGNSPAWTSCSAAASNFWQLNGKILSPVDLNNDLAVGGNSTSSAKFQVFAETVGADTAGQASTSAGFTFADIAGTNPPIDILNGNTLTFKTSPGGDASLTNSLLVGPNNIQFYSSSNQITSAGALTLASNLTVNGTSITVGNGSTSTIGTTNAALNLNSGSGVLTLNNGGAGNIDFFSTSNVLTSGGNLSLNGTLAVNQGGSAATKTTIDSSGNLLPGTDGGANLGSSTLAWNNLFVKNLNLPLAGGIDGYWQLSSGANYGVLAPTNTQNDLAVGGAATSSAAFQIFGESYINDLGTVPAGTATTAGNLTFRGTAGSQTLFQINTLNGSNLGFYNSVGGDKGITTSTPLLYLANNGNVGIGTNNPGAVMEIQGAYQAPSNTNATLRLVSTDTSSVVDKGGSVAFFGQDGSGTSRDWGIIGGFKENSTNGNTNGYLAFYTRPNAGSFGERMRITSGGTVGIGTTSPLNQAGLDIEKNGLGNAILDINQTGLGDIFTASASGTPKLVLNNAGYLGLNTVTPQGILDVASQGSTFPSDLTLGQVAATNLITNPSFENATSALTGWITSGQPQFSANDPATESALFGSKDLRFYSVNNGNFHAFSNCMTVSASTSYAASGYMYIKSNYVGTAQLKVTEYTSANCTTGSSITQTVSAANTPNVWQRVSKVFTTGGSTASLQVTFSHIAASGNAYADGFQVEKSATVTPYLDGSLGPGYAWTGVPNNSTSTRSSGSAFAYQTLNSANGLGAASGGFAPTLQLDQDGTGDIIDASASGITQFQLSNTGNVIARKFTDLDNPIYYLDPAGLTTSASLAGSMTFTPAAEHDINYLNGSAINFQRSAGGDAGLTSSLYISGVGNVGIGTTTPGATLDVVGSATVSGNLTFYGGVRTIQNTNMNSLTIGGNTTGSLLLDSSQNANNFVIVRTSGIVNGQGALRFDQGTTNFYTMWTAATGTSGFASELILGYDGTSASNNHLLDIRGNGTVNLGTGTAVDQTELDLNGNVSNVAALINNTGTGDLFTASVSSSTKFVIKNNGNVGIGGQATPLTALDITGSASTSGSISFRGAGTEHDINLLQGGSLNILNSVGGDVGLTGNTDLYVQANTGNVGIGTASPGKSLDVAGTFTLGSSGTTGTIYGASFTRSAGSNTFPDIFGNGTNALVIAGKSDGTGTTTINGTVNVNVTSASSTSWLCKSATLSGIRTIDECGAGATFGDFAENIVAPNTDQGDVITLDPLSATQQKNNPLNEQTTIAVKSNTPYDPKLLGGISTTGIGYDAPTNNSAINPASWRRLAVSGVIPIKVSTINGPIHQGDSITSSIVPGVGMKATKTGMMLGRAVEDFLDTNATQAARLVNGSWEVTDGACRTAEQNCYNEGKVVTLVNTVIADPQVYLSDTGDIQIVDQTPSTDFTIPHYYSLTDALGSPITRVEELAQLAVGSLRAGVVNSQQVITTSLAVTTDNVSIAGQSLHDYVASIVSQMVNSQSSIVNSPVAEVNELHTNIISPLASGSAVAISLDNSGINITNTVSQQTVARIDNTGNATFSGQLTSKNLAVSGDATISGTLYADKIKANSIEGLSEVVSTLSAQNITNVTNIIFATPSGTPIADNTITGSNGNSSSPSGLPNQSQQFNNIAVQQSGYASVASYSAFLAYIPSLRATTGLFDQGLVSLGPTSLADTSITGTLSVGSQMILADTSLNVLGSDFAIQPLRQGGVNFEGGLIAIDTSGNLMVHGKATFNSGVFANIISPIGNNDLEFHLGNQGTSGLTAAGSPDGGRLVATNASGSGIFTIDQLGNVAASGTATFNKLNLGLVQPAYALSDTEVVATGSAGTATIKPYQHEVTIDNPQVTANSLIYITPVGTQETPYLERQVSGSSFSVGIPASLPTAVNFNWLIVN